MLLLTYTSSKIPERSKFEIYLHHETAVHKLYTYFTHTFGGRCLQVICFGHPVSVAQFSLSALQQWNLLKVPEDYEGLLPKVTSCSP